MALCQAGHQVSVVTGYPNYPHGKIYPPYCLRPWQWETLDSVRVLRVPHLIDRSRSGMRRLISYASFSASSLCLGSIKISKPDVIWTYQIGLPGVILGVLRGVPLVHEVQDLWPEWGRISNLGLKTWLYRLLEWQEQLIYQRARLIVTITDSFKQILVRKGVPLEKIAIVPNWANKVTFHPEAYDSNLAEQEGFSGHFNVVYIGNVGTAQALGVLLDAAERLRSIPRVQFVVIGDGLERVSLERQARTRGLANIIFLGSRPQAQAAHYMALADVLFLHLKHSPEFAITIPSKAYSYLASARPVLAAAEGELASLIQGLQAGVVCPPEDAPALADAVRQLEAMPSEQRVAMGQAGLQAVSTTYNRATLGKNYAELFEKVISTSKGRSK